MLTRLRHLLAFATTCLALAALSSSASAATAAGDSVTGSGLVPNGAFYVDAHSGPSGENPTGTVTSSLITGYFVDTSSGPVTCLNVSGNTAIVGFTLTGAGGYQTQGLVKIVDNTASGQPDTLTWNQGPYPTTANPCATLPNPGPTQTVGTYAPANINGFTVVDVVPVPTFKDQCKKGGWQSFGTMFKNQGQCVAYVERGPRQ